MKNAMLLIVAVAGGLMASSGVALAEDKPDCNKDGMPQMVEGQVTTVDMNQGKLGIRAADGTMHEFQASKETLGDYKVGDPIKAKLRMDPRCS